MSDVVGILAVRTALRTSVDQARCLYILKGRRDARVNELIGMAREQGVRFRTVEGPWFKRRVVDGEAHQGVLLELSETALATEQEMLEALPEWTSPRTILVLDGVTDPRNLGACIRTANGAGVQAVMLPKRNSAPLNIAALKAAQGGQEGVMVVAVTNLVRSLKKLADAGFWLVGTDDEAGGSYSECRYDKDLVMVLGSEDKGLRRLTRERCDQMVRIPMYGSVESLNVSVAAGIVLFERRRQLAEQKA